MNKLYFADNLEIMRKMEDGFVDLIATDPPFNSGHNYQAYTDTWQWDTEAEMAYQELLLVNGQIGNTIEGVRKFLNETPMMAYLVMMATRLVEMHRILRDTGSIYLHCDPSASHYLKILLDAVFGVSAFRNEIVWHYYNGSSNSKKNYASKHDIIFFYADKKQNTFDDISAREPYVENSNWVKNWVKNPKSYGGKYRGNPNGKRMHDVWRIPSINNMAKERTGYPTQKPLALYERIIKASSNEGDLILDPFCGCGTTLEAAHKLGRSWIGIDLNIIALDPIRQRMAERHSQDNEPLQPHKHYEIIGYPTNMQ